MRAPNNTMLTAALAYAAIGLYVFPADLSDGQKKSHKSAEHSNGRKWGMTKDPREIERDFKRWPDAIGIPTGAINGIFVVEIDTPKGHDVDGAASLRALEATYGPLPATRMAESPSGSIHYYFLHPGDGIKIKNSASEIALGVDVRGDGGMVIAPPSKRKDGEYRWINNRDPAVAPLWLIELVKLKERKPADISSSGGSGGEPTAPLYKVLAAVAVTPNDDLGWEDWNTHGLAIYDATDGSADGLTIFDVWSQKSRKNNAAATTAKWEAYHKSPPDRIGAGSVFHWAGEACPKWEVLAYERPGTIAAQMAEIMDIARLASLPDMLYERVRKESAEQLNIRVSVLDETVQRLRPPKPDDEAGGAHITFDPPEPWPYDVDGAELLDDMVKAIRSHVILNEHQALAVALWVIHAHAIECAEHTPRLQFKSPTIRCGKSTALRTIRPMVPKAISTENITTAALFRMIELCCPTLLIDEADSFLKREDGRDNEELRGILNAGHARGGAVIRTVGDNHEPKSFTVFGPIAFAWLVRNGKHVSETLADRSITIELRRRLPEETIVRLRSNRTEHLNLLQRRAARWVADHATALANADPILPEELGDRAQDNWRPLLAIADVMPGGSAERARSAALKIDAEKVDDELDVSLMALADVATIFELTKAERLSSQHLISALIAMEDRPWSEWRRGAPLTKNSLARLLKPFGIKPKEIRFFPKPAATAKGYEAEPIRMAKERYVDETKLVEEVDDPEPDPEPEIPF